MICQISIPWQSSVDDHTETYSRQLSMLKTVVDDVGYCYASFSSDKDGSAIHVWEIKCDESLLCFLLLKVNATFLREIYEQY